MKYSTNTHAQPHGISPKPFFRVTHEAMQTLMELSDASLGVYLALSSRSNEAGLCAVRYADLATMCSCSAATVKRGVRQLKSSGLLTVTEQRGECNLFDLSATMPTAEEIQEQEGGAQ